MRTIVIDPGHGGRDPGAVGLAGTQEKAIVLEIAKKMAAVLHKNFYVRLTRNNDVALTLASRAVLANSLGASALISLHCNAATNRQAHGFEVFTTPGQNRSDLLAESVIKSVGKAIPSLRMRRDMRDGDSDKEARFAVLTQARVPAILVELAFISNAQEEVLLRDVGFQRTIAEALAEGVINFLT